MIKPIVEGHGELAALPILLRRIAGERFKNWDPPILRPGRYRSSSLLKKRNGVWEFGPDLRKAAGHARNEHATALLILLDADESDFCVKEVTASLAPLLVAETGFKAVAMVFAVREYEAWLLASAETLTAEALPYPYSPERHRDAKRELERHLGLSFPYDARNDQPAYTSKLDLDLCESRSRSFRKFIKEFERLLVHCSAAPN